MADGHEIVHASAIALGNKAALIRGPSGHGKSDLAFRCIMHAPSSVIKDQACLIADDRVVVQRRADDLIASPPETLAGLIEIRGLGIYRLAHKSAVPIALVVDLVPRENIERMPDSSASVEIMAITLPVIQICAFDASAANKVLLALSGVPCIHD